MFNYLRGSIKRKVARRITREYPAVIRSYNLEKEGTIRFACWQNPLAPPFSIGQESVDFFRRFIKKGDLVIDIGAGIGDTTVPMGIAAGADGLTLGFDPNPFVFRVLEINASLNKGKANIVPYRYAVSSNDQEFFYISSEASYGNGAISPVRNSKHGRFVHPDKVQGINLIDFLDKNYRSWLGKLTFIKIDAEGYDREIIESLSGLLRRYNPVLVAESFGGNSDEEKLELYDLINSLGYETSCFIDFDINTPLTLFKTRSDILKWKKTINLFAVPC